MAETDISKLPFEQALAELEEIVKGRVAARFGPGRMHIRHDVDVNVAVTGVTETCDLEPVLFLQAIREREKLFKPSPWHHDVLVKFREPGVTQRIRKLTSQLPKLFAFDAAVSPFNE